MSRLGIYTLLVAAMAAVVASMTIPPAPDCPSTDCIMCPAVMPRCPPCAADQTCSIIPQTCQACSSAVCVPKSSGTGPIGPAITPVPGVLPGETGVDNNGGTRPEENCIFCTAVLPRCPVCAADEYCDIVSQTCTSCSYAVCRKLSDKSYRKPYTKSVV